MLAGAPEARGYGEFYKENEELTRLGVREK